MITVREIEDLFRNEKYEKAVTEIKRALPELSDDDTLKSELLYYLFLAENGDYSNMNLDDVSNELAFNSAISNAILRLKNEYTAEYNFYRAVDSGLRKYFVYAARCNVEAFGDYLNSYGVRTSSLINDNSSEREFYSNLDYIVTSRVVPVIIDLNLLSLNILYLATGNSGVKRVWETLKDRALQVQTRLSTLPFCDSMDEIRKAYKALISGEKVKTGDEIKAEEDKKKLEEKLSNLEKQVTTLEKDKAEMQKNLDKSQASDPERQVSYSSVNNVSDTTESSKKWDNFAKHGKRLSIWGFFLSFIFIGVNFAVLGIVFGCLGKKSVNSNSNGSKAAIRWGVLGIIIGMAEYVLYIMVALGAFY